MVDFNIPNKKTKQELKQKRKELTNTIKALKNKQNKDDEDMMLLQYLIISDNIIGMNLKKEKINGVQLNDLYNGIDNIIEKHNEYQNKKNKNKNK